MHIQNLTIKNFRCFRKLELNLETLGIIVGENGTGKTAILEALNYAFSPNFLSSRIDEQDFNNSDEGDIEIRVRLDQSFNVILHDGYISREVPCDQVVLLIKRRERGAPNKAFSDPFTVTHYVIPDETVQQPEEGTWEILRKSGNPFIIKERNLRFPIESKDFPRVFYLNKERDNQSESGFNTTLERIITEYNWRFRKKLKDFDKDYLKNWETLFQQKLAAIDNKKYKETFLDVRSKLPDITGDDFSSLELSTLNLEQPFKKAFFSIRTGLNQVSFRNFGSGISMLFSFCFLETISSLAEESIIFLIDEPELHLHPQLQQKLFDFMSNGESQVIYCTHSQLLVPLNFWKSIIRISKDFEHFPSLETMQNHVVYKGQSESIENHLEDINKYYQDRTIFLKENNHLFFSRMCLLVEGPVDKYAIEILSKFDITNLTIITCYGKDKIFYYQLLCIAFKIPFFCLFDLDELEITIEPNKTIIECCTDGSYFAFKDSLEKCLNISVEKHKASKAMIAIDNLNDDLPEELSDALEKIENFIKQNK